MNPTNASDPFGFGSLDDIFRAMNQGMDQPQQPNAQVPPTQAGRGGNNCGLSSQWQVVRSVWC